MEAAYREVERRCSIQTVPPTAHSLATERLIEGAERIGIPFHPLRRNASRCEGNSMCTFGCPAQAKMSVDLAYLPSAFRHGARVVSDALVERVVIENGRAAGVEGRLLSGAYGAPSFPFRVHAPLVVAACGTVHTPLLLHKSGIARKHPDLGRHLTMAPFHQTRVLTLRAPLA